MRKTFTGPNRERELSTRQVSAWIETQKGLIKKIQVSETLVRSVNSRSLTPKAQGDLTVTVTYEKSIVGRQNQPALDPAGKLWRFNASSH
jgi:hypothetical protein